jgi:hypothetical protein
LRKGSSQEDMKTRPWRLTTAYSWPVGELPCRRRSRGCRGGVVGGAKDAAAADVGVGGDGHVLEDLRLSQMWLPVVMTWAPRSKSSSAMEGVMPKPPAAFSPLMMRRSTALVSRTCREVLADDVAAGGAEDVADEEDVLSLFDAYFHCCTRRGCWRARRVPMADRSWRARRRRSRWRTSIKRWMAESFSILRRWRGHRRRSWDWC